MLNKEISEIMKKNELILDSDNNVLIKCDCCDCDHVSCFRMPYEEFVKKCKEKSVIVVYGYCYKCLSYNNCIGYVYVD